MRRYTLQIKGKEYTIDVQDLSANDFRVMLNDQSFDVRLSDAQEIAGAQITPQVTPLSGDDESAVERPAIVYRPPSPDAVDQLRATSAPALPPASRSGANDTERDITAPMPGTILTVEVKSGEEVTRGQAVCVLEAMKMKNTIRAPRDGMLSEVAVQAGQTVRYGQVLARFEEVK
jgi:glutaconyl-CoA decarboxylase